jgi:hypothetical protein
MCFALLEGFQSSPDCPSDKISPKASITMHHLWHAADRGEPKSSAITVSDNGSGDQPPEPLHGLWKYKIHSSNA